MRWKSILKYCLALVLNSVPFIASAWIFWHESSVVFILSAVLAVLLHILNYRWAKGTLPFVLLNLVMLGSSAFSVKLSTILDYELSTYIDEFIPILGDIAFVCIIVLIAVMTAIGAIVKYAENQHPEE